MGMPLQQLLRHAANDILQGKEAFFLRHPGVEDDLHEHIAQFFLHPIQVALIQRFQIFITFFDEVRPNGMKILLPVPGAAVRLPQGLDHVRQGADVKGRFPAQGAVFGPHGVFAVLQVFLRFFRRVRVLVRKPFPRFGDSPGVPAGRRASPAGSGASGGMKILVKWSMWGCRSASNKGILRHSSSGNPRLRKTRFPYRRAKHP